MAYRSRLRISTFPGHFRQQVDRPDAFREVFHNQEFYKTLRNTLMLNFLDLLISFPAPLILAIMLYELNIGWFKRLSQTILYIPHFISWVIIGGIVTQVFGTQSGMINNLLEGMGFSAIPFLRQKKAGSSPT